MSTPLLLATTKGHYYAVVLLLDNGANINEGGRWNYTPLYTSLNYRYDNIALLLISRGADIDMCFIRGIFVSEGGYVLRVAKRLIDLLYHNYVSDHVANALR